MSGAEPTNTSFLSTTPLLPGTDLQNNRTQAEFGLICSGEKTRRLLLESLLSQKLGSHFSQIGAVFRRHRAKRCSRSQASNPGRRGGRRSLGIGMEIGEGAGGPGGPDGPGIRFGCASFNQDSTSLALGTKTNYKLFSLTMVEKLDCIHESGQYEALTALCNSAG
ncbi:WD repeat domain phosphoinositide-interacting protein 1 [Larimichthys crocea]|uniref:Uncharacterized protein n=1 Tax=Larimichthys crocea TaxID=215358 RepID=A0ACD3R600_LARCR|nr:WD repeat domain phosphoinositide-interacting protein 1 [Larimichthys crocea]